MEYYLYRHIRLDKNEPFYIGIGKKLNKFKHIKSEYARAYTLNRRNTHWTNITNSTKYEVEILFESDNHNFISEKEKEFIKLHGRADLGFGTLCNLTDGGGGSINYKFSQETKDKISKSHVGKKVSSDIKKLLLKYAKMPRSQEFKTKRAELMKGNTYSLGRKKSNKEKIRQSEISKEFHKNLSTEERNRLNDITRKANSKKVISLKDDILIKEYSSLVEASQDLKVTIQAISQAIKKNRKSKGLTWMFKK